MARSNILAAWQTKLRSENMGAVVEMVTFRGYQHGLAGELGVGIGSFRPRGFGTSASPVRWATAAVTWDGNAIPARIIERSDITQKAGGEHEVTLTLSALPDDVPERSTFIDSDVVYSWIEPGGTTELTLMRGLVTAAEGDEKKVVIRVAGHMSGNNRKIPAYTTTAECPMMFRGLGCGYVKTTDIVGAQPAVPSGTDILCVSTADLEVGRYLISDPNGTPTPVEISAITDATNFQVGSTSTWADADAVMYADCRKTFIDCAQRKREHAYRGFRATQELRGSTLVERLERYVGLGDPWTPSGRPIRGFEFMDYLFNLDAYLGSLSPSGENTTGLQTIFDTTPVNIPYGRVVVRARMIERHHVIADPGSGDVTYAVGFYLLGRGEIDGVEAVYTSDYQLRNYIEGGGPDVPEGTEIYWRPGKDGSATQYTEADWQSDRATMTTASDEHGFKLDEGKTDFRTNTGTAYSGVGYMIVMMPLGRGIGLGSDDARDGLDDLPEQLLVRLRGVKVQKYLTNGAPDGAKAFSQNPWWCLRDLLDDGLYGHGVPSDIYQPASWKSSADYADAVITNQGMRTEVRITMAQPLTVIPVNTVEGFLQGQTVEISSTDYTVEEIDVLGQALVLDTALQLTEGDTIVGERERFIVALDVNRQKKVKDWVKLFISAARGHLRMDGDQLAAFTELGIFGGEAGLNQTDLGYQLGTKPRSFKFHGARESKNRYNQLEITYTKGHSLGFETALMRVPDADAGGLAAPKPKSLDLSACPTPEQALRCGLARYAKIGALGNGDGNNDFSDVGITLTTGPNALETMVGEHFEAQRRITPEGQSQRTTTKRGRIVEMVLTRGPKFSVKLKALPERQQLRMEAFGPSIACFTDTPYVAGLSGRPYSDSPPELPNPTITLQLLAFSGGVAQFRLVFTGGGSRFRVPRAVELHASTTSGFTPEIGVPNSSTRVASWRRMSYVLNWVIPDELLGETLYFIATARQARLGQDAVQSAEISSEMVLDDPTNTDPESGNRVYQGGLDSARAWSATAGTLEWDQASPYSIEADATVPGGDWTNPDNAHDGDDLTYGELTVDSGNTGLVAFTFAAGTLSGQPFARVRTTKNNAAMVVQYSTDGGGSWSDVAQVSVRQGLVDVYGPLLVSQNMANFQMRVGGGSGRGIGAPYAEGHHRAYTVGFVDIAGATPPYVILANGLATFVSDGITAAELKRPFPGKIPDPTVLAYNAQSTATVGLDLRRTPGETSALDANMTVYIKEKLTGTEYLAADFDKDDIPTDGVFDALVQRFTPGAAIPGDCEIIIRYLGTVALDLDNIEETLGEGVPRQFQASTVDQEEGNYGDAASGKRVGFTRGLWPTVVTRISQITGGTK